MKCYTYNKNKINKGVSDTYTNKLLNTCALSISMPEDWDVSSFLNYVKNKDYCDILLYCNTKLVDGDSESSIFPADCVLLCCLDKALIMENIDNSCLEIRTENLNIYYVLFNNSMLFDSASSKYIKNVEGTLCILNDNPVCDDTTDELGTDPDEYVISL